MTSCVTEVQVSTLTLIESWAVLGVQWVTSITPINMLHPFQTILHRTMPSMEIWHYPIFRVKAILCKAATYRLKLRVPACSPLSSSVWTSSIHNSSSTTLCKVAGVIRIYLPRSSRSQQKCLKSATRAFQASPPLRAPIQRQRGRLEKTASTNETARSAISWHRTRQQKRVCSTTRTCTSAIRGTRTRRTHQRELTFTERLDESSRVTRLTIYREILGI